MKHGEKEVTTHMETLGKIFGTITKGIVSFMRLAFIGGLAAGTFLRDVVAKKPDAGSSSES